MVDATPARERLEWLAEQGVGRKRIQRLTGLSSWILQGIRSGIRQRIRRTTADRILACPVSVADGRTTTAWWPRRHVHALRQEGYSDAQIAKWIGCQPKTLFRVERTRVGIARRAERAYREITGESDSPLAWGAGFQTFTQETQHGS